MPHAVSINSLSFSWPDGTEVLRDVNATFPEGHTALIGDNGSGKTTLLRLIAGALVPSAGSVTVSGRVGHLHQHVSNDTQASVSDMLGISPIRLALDAIGAGSLDEADFTTVGDDWDIETRAVAHLSALGLDADAPLLDRPATTLSGGEAMQVALAGARLSRWDITLLDEPTNNLDARARSSFVESLTTWPGVVIVVTHDREVLEHVGTIVDLDPRGTTSFTGTFTQYQQYKAGRQEAADRALTEARARIRTATRQAQVELERQQQRDRSARTQRAQGNVGKGAADFFQNRAEKSAGAKGSLHSERLAEAHRRRARADAEARTPDPIAIDLPTTRVPSGKRILHARVRGEELDLHGPSRIHLTGDNGSGKSTLLGLLTGATSPAHPVVRQVLGATALHVAPTVPVGHLTQRHDGLAEHASVTAAVQAAAPHRPAQEARDLLGRLQLRGDVALQDPATLSGGQLFRVALARVLFADPAPRLLVLDEPTNNLDLSSVDQLIAALAGYHGALVVVTHDAHLARGLGVQTRWHLTADAITISDVRPASGRSAP